LKYAEVRLPGGGRMPLVVSQDLDIDQIFLAVIDAYIAGDPMDASVRWIKLTRGEISEKMAVLGIKVSRNIIRQLLKKHDFVKRKMQREIRGGIFENRNEQFQNIIGYKQEYLDSDNPIISIDTKKKELLGNLHRAGSVYCKDMQHIALLQDNEPAEINDFKQHDSVLLLSKDGLSIYGLMSDKTIEVFSSALFIQQVSTALAKNTIEPNPTPATVIEELQSLSKEKFAKIAKLFRLYLRDEAIKVYDHDFLHLSTGKIVPHGIYDMKQNKAFINIGNSYETAEFVCDSIKQWWSNYGKFDYPNATEILIFSDAGGANSYRHHIYKIELQGLVNAIKMPIKISHYPPYASKWNPIEHLVFPHITKAMEGIVLKTEEQAAEVISTAKTKTGLVVITNVIKKVYQKGKVWTKETVEKIQIKRGESLGQLNYTITPQST
jgi:hypothetical protein